MWERDELTMTLWVSLSQHLFCKNPSMDECLRTTDGAGCVDGKPHKMSVNNHALFVTFIWGWWIGNKKDKQRNDWSWLSIFSHNAFIKLWEKYSSSFLRLFQEILFEMVANCDFCHKVLWKSHWVIDWQSSSIKHLWMSIKKSFLLTMFLLSLK